LVARSVADFYGEFMALLGSLGIRVKINTHPVEVDDDIPFEDDNVHAAYESSPVQFWWGSFDIATTRFSGRPAPPRAWPARWMARGADQEQANAGFWPGNDKLPEPAFVGYTYPEPPGCRTATIYPDAAFFHPELAEFILPFEPVRQSADPDQMILDFYRGTYEIGATLAGWDRAALERAV
jgi:hypothetical protein